MWCVNQQNSVVVALHSSSWIGWNQAASAVRANGRTVAVVGPIYNTMLLDRGILLSVEEGLLFRVRQRLVGIPVYRMLRKKMPSVLLRTEWWPIELDALSPRTLAAHVISSPTIVQAKITLHTRHSILKITLRDGQTVLQGVGRLEWRLTRHLQSTQQL